MDLIYYVKKNTTAIQALTIVYRICYTSLGANLGEMSEWFMELVLKTSDAEKHRGFESLSLRQKRRN